MANAKTNGSLDADDRQSIEQLTERYKNLDREKTVAETSLKHAKEHLDRLKKDAKAQYGTDDIDELKSNLKEMEDDNEQKRAEYQTKLDNIESSLAEVKKQYDDVEAPSQNDEVVDQ